MKGLAAPFAYLNYLGFPQRAGRARWVATSIGTFIRTIFAILGRIALESLPAGGANMMASLSLSKPRTFSGTILSTLDSARRYPEFAATILADHSNSIGRVAEFIVAFWRTTSLGPTSCWWNKCLAATSAGYLPSRYPFCYRGIKTLP